MCNTYVLHSTKEGKFYTGFCRRPQTKICNVSGEAAQILFNRVNMVRAGVVKHPAEWPFCGYNEIQNPRQRYSLIDYHKLIPLLQMKDIGELQESCRKRVEEDLATRNQSRDIDFQILNFTVLNPNLLNL